jgi:hypothetical protein
MAARSIRAVFVIGSVVLITLAVAVRRIMVDRAPLGGAAPAVEES